MCTIVDLHLMMMIGGLYRQGLAVKPSNCCGFRVISTLHRSCHRPNPLAVVAQAAAGSNRRHASAQNKHVRIENFQTTYKNVSLKRGKYVGILRNLTAEEKALLPPDKRKQETSSATIPFAKEEQDEVEALGVLGLFARLLLALGREKRQNILLSKEEEKDIKK
eukprot:gene29214-6178_t